MKRGVNRWILFAAILLTLTRCAAWTEAAESRSFYDGRTTTLIISTSPGGATDVAGRLVARHLAKYIPGDPNIIAQNMAGAGGIVSANYLFNVAKPDGLTILAVNRANYLEQMVGRPEVKLDFRKLSWVGSFNRAPMMITCRKDTPYTSVENMRAAKTRRGSVKAEPGASAMFSAVWLPRFWISKSNTSRVMARHARSISVSNAVKQTAAPPRILLASDRLGRLGCSKAS